MDAGITLVITSCGRYDLLRRTIKSILLHNTFPFAKTVIVEDAAVITPFPQDLRDWLATETLRLGPVVIIENAGRKGQTYSIDRAYSEVTTEWIFHCEDDWEFRESNFIERSMEILLAHPEVWTVNLRANDCNGHPLKLGEKYAYLEPYWSGGWGGITFNPGLRRLSDYKKLGSYGRHMGYGTHGFETELALSIKHLDEGRLIASLGKQYVWHIGEGKSIAADKSWAPKPPCVLIAIPACHKYTYGAHSDGRNHVDQVSNVRVDAVRKTWARYMPPFTNADLKFFYGTLPLGTDRTPSADEVFLKVADDYEHLPHKVQAIFKYALDNGYDFVFKGDDDTFIYVDRLMASGFEHLDYTGFVSIGATNWDNGGYCSGGSGYWVSKLAMSKIVAAPVDDWAEDRWVGRVLGQCGINFVRDARYLPGFWEHFVNVDAIGEDHSYISMHACTPAMMEKLFAKTLPPNFKKVQRAFHEDSQAPSAPAPRGNIAIEGLRVTSKIKYAADGMTTDWWDSHKRVE